MGRILAKKRPCPIQGWYAEGGWWLHLTPSPPVRQRVRHYVGAPRLPFRCVRYAVQLPASRWDHGSSEIARAGSCRTGVADSPTNMSAVRWVLSVSCWERKSTALRSWRFSCSRSCTRLSKSEQTCFTISTSTTMADILSSKRSAIQSRNWLIKASMETIPSTLISVGRLLVLNPEARRLSGGVPALDFAPSFADKLPIPPRADHRQTDTLTHWRACHNRKRASAETKMLIV